ncbi:MAG: AAA family ATPase [Patescibacteria group bacterium]
MKIRNIEIKNFRNISKADISFGDLNVFTGRNSSGKSNFLLAISSALKIKTDYTQEFGGNNVTIGQGLRTTSLKTSIENKSARTCFVGGNQVDEQTDFFCVETEAMIFEKVLDKNSFSTLHKLFFTGKQYVNRDREIKWSAFAKDNSLFEKGAVTMKDTLVYEKNFSKTENIGDTNIIQSNPIKNPQGDNYFAIFEHLQNSVVSQFRPKFLSVDMGNITTALSLHKYVTDKGNEQIYQEALRRLKDGGVPSNKTSLENSEFIFLISDIEKNKIIKEKFANDLNLYTKGIVRGVSINSKGSLSVSSPNGPDGIWTISNGTSVLVFFITLLNWINLRSLERSYQLPHVLLLDETDSIVHPTILIEFIEVLRALSRRVQIFITTHSPYFLDGFSTEEIFYIKDAASIAGDVVVEGANRCNIYNYKTIIENLSPKEQKYISDKKNSELFCQGTIEGIFPVKEV